MPICVYRRALAAQAVRQEGQCQEGEERGVERGEERGGVQHQHCGRQWGRGLGEGRPAVEDEDGLGKHQGFLWWFSIIRFKSASTSNQKESRNKSKSLDSLSQLCNA